MSKPTLFIDKLRNNPNAKISIVWSSGNVLSPPRKANVVSGFITQDFAFSAEASYNSPFENSSQESFSSKINQFLTTSNAVLNTNFSQFQIKDIRQTFNMWVSSNQPDFSIQMLFISIRGDEDVREKVSILNKTVYPTINKNGNLILAPIGYKIQNKTATNTVTLRIGKWFLARGLLVTNVSSVFSQEVGANGTPLYAQVQVSLKPFKLITEKEARNYFIKVV